MRLKTFEKITLYDARYRIGYGLLIGLGLFLLVFRLGSLLPGLSGPEVTSAQTSTVSDIRQNPINAPYRLLQGASVKVFGATDWAVRLPSVMFGVLTIFALFVFLRRLYGERIAIMGSLLVGFSSFFLIYARLGTPSIMMAWAIAALLAVGAWILTSEKITSRHIISAAVVGSVALYVPFGWLWLLLIILAKPKELINTIKQGNNFAIAGFVLILLAAIGPIAFAASQNTALLKDFVLWPDVVPNLRAFLGNIVRVLLAPFWRDTLADPVTHLGNLPLLDIFSSAMVILGGLTLLFKPTLARTRVLIIILTVSVISIAATRDRGAFAMLIVPFAVLGAVGLHRLLGEWYEMFPKNPFARVGALAPVAIVLLMAVYYQLHRTYVAWPRNPDVKASYNQKL